MIACYNNNPMRNNIGMEQKWDGPSVYSIFCALELLFDVFYICRAPMQLFSVLELRDMQ